MYLRLVAAIVLASGLTVGSYAQTCPTPAALATSLSAAQQAEVLDLGGIDPTTCPEITMSNTWEGGKLIFSDSPESPTTRGILYKDATLSATRGTNYNRIFLYHVNGGSSAMKFVVILTNLGSSTGTMTVQQSGTAGPSNSYLYVGKMAFERWLQATASNPVNVAAGASVELDTAFDALTASTNQLMHGIWDYSFTQPHKITICALNASDNPISTCNSATGPLSILARDTHQRGTFPYADVEYDSASGVVIDTASGIEQLPIGGNTANDPDAVGVDATSNSSVRLAGNYGILYRIHLNTSSSDGKNLGFLFNPRGGAWGGALQTSSGLTQGGIFLIPASTASVCCNTQGALDGSYAPGSGMQVWLRFMPVGDSSLPVLLVAAPF